MDFVHNTLAGWATVYCQSTPVSATELALMRRIDPLQQDHPFAGVRACCVISAGGRVYDWAQASPYPDDAYRDRGGVSKARH